MVRRGYRPNNSPKVCVSGDNVISVKQTSSPQSQKKTGEMNSPVLPNLAFLLCVKDYAAHRLLTMVSQSPEQGRMTAFQTF